MFKKYNIEIAKILSSPHSPSDWEKISKRHKRMVEFIRHERLIHLIVTLFTGTVMAMAFFVTIITKSPALLLLDIPLLALFLGYIVHYRFLENTTQNWHSIIESIENKRH